MGYTLEATNLAQTQGAEEDRPVLFAEVSFSWESPAVHVIMGPSGEGKSALLKSIGGVWKPSSGELRADKRLLWGRQTLIQDSDSLSRIGFAFQNNALFSSLRVVENICFPHRQRFPQIPELERQRIGHEWLHRVGLGHTAHQYPDELSGGMQKRLAIARTLALEPDYIFLDDPTAGLDPITSRQIADLIATLLAGREALVIIVTNDPDRAKAWGPNIHFLSQQRLHSPGSLQYSELWNRFL